MKNSDKPGIYCKHHSPGVPTIDYGTQKNRRTDEWAWEPSELLSKDDEKALLRAGFAVGAPHGRMRTAIPSVPIADRVLPHALLNGEFVIDCKNQKKKCTIVDVVVSVVLRHHETFGKAREAIRESRDSGGMVARILSSVVLIRDDGAEMIFPDAIPQEQDQ